MERLLGYDNKFFEMLGKITDIIILNFLCIFFSIPIVTIGASVTSTYYITMKMVKDEEPYIFKTFLKTFKENFKSSTIVWIIFMVIGGILLLDLNICNQLDNKTIVMIMKIIFITIGIIYIFALTYVFPIISKFENTIKNTMINSILMSVSNLPYTILMVLINIIPLILIMIFTGFWGYILFFYIVIGVGITAFFNSIFLDRILNKYINE